MRGALAAAMGLALALAVGTPAWAMDTQAVFEKARDSVVVVLAYDSRGKVRSFGTGFFVGHGDLVATNNHVIDKAAGLKIKLDGKDLLDVIEVKAVDQDRDLALLKVARPGKALELAEDETPVGADVVAIGTPMGLEKTVSNGVLSGIRETPLREHGRKVTIYQMTAPVSPGSSGGPVLDAQGRVVAVSTFILRQGQNLNFAVPASYIARLMGHRGSSGLRLDPGQAVGIEKDESGTIHILTK